MVLITDGLNKSGLSGLMCSAICMFVLEKAFDGKRKGEVGNQFIATIAGTIELFKKPLSLRHRSQILV